MHVQAYHTLQLVPARYVLRLLPIMHSSFVCMPWMRSKHKAKMVDEQEFPEGMLLYSLKQDVGWTPARNSERLYDKQQLWLVWLFGGTTGHLPTNTTTSSTETCHGTI
eukprot:jgi/Chrzof1/13319/Cz07g28230.t1